MHYHGLNPCHNVLISQGHFITGFKLSEKSRDKVISLESWSLEGLTYHGFHIL